MGGQEVFQRGGGEPDTFDHDFHPFTIAGDDFRRVS